MFVCLFLFPCLCLSVCDCVSVRVWPVHKSMCLCVFTVKFDYVKRAPDTLMCLVLCVCKYPSVCYVCARACIFPFVKIKCVRGSNLANLQGVVCSRERSRSLASLKFTMFASVNR